LWQNITGEIRSKARLLIGRDDVGWRLRRLSFHETPGLSTAPPARFSARASYHGLYISGGLHGDDGDGAALSKAPAKATNHFSRLPDPTTTGDFRHSRDNTRFRAIHRSLVSKGSGSVAVVASE
jgi:hypothetical protein